MANTTKYTDISPRTQVYADANMLAHAEPILVLSKLGQTKPIPQHKSQTIKFRRPTPFAPATTALTEGVAPAAQKMAYEDVEVQLKQYGAWTEITDVIQDTHEDPVLRDLTMLSGEQAAETMEMITWGAISSGTNVIYTTGTQTNAVKDPLSINHIRAAVRKLQKNRAKKKTSILDGSIKYGTKPIEASYIAVCHTDLESDIRNLPNFTPVAAYGSRSPISPQELGTVENVRFITSPLFTPTANAGAAPGGKVVSTNGSNADVYKIVVFGQDAFAVCPLKGKESAQMKIRNPGKAEEGNPLGQRGSVGWIAWHAAKILNEAWLTRIEAATTAL
ncbi:N4-gp56 family major capsid protein [Pasteurella oralis]|uniref:N4-gp56 family major capsid protein n=1 Tax=Pasteurella oralis TaxID=1071947 RepID=UPI000C7D5C10|nr:N4-gp56 family major capsid protein [Pasteurella oralis]